MSRGRPRPSKARAKRAEGEDDLLGALGLLRERRLPYDGPLTAIVADTLRRFLPPRQGALVEIGAGAGQLRHWLPAASRRHVIHSDVSSRALRSLRAHAADPGARALVAAAASLPFADGSCDAVLALCVFDAIAEADQDVVVRELRRVLRPGGRFIHFLDMATLLEEPFKKLATSGLVPLPNVFGDPADDEWPVDLVLVKQDWLAGLMDFAIRTLHPLASGFGDLFAAFLQPPGRFDVNVAARLFKAVASDGPRRQSLATSLASASGLAAQWGHPRLSPLPFHSGKYLASVLRTAFGDAAAFRLELCDISTAGSLGSAGAAAVPRYRSLCLGHQRVMDNFPSRLLTAAARARLASQEDREAACNAGETLVEAGVFVFVTERL